MSSHDILVLILVSLLIVILPAIGLFKLFPKAGIESWKAWVPFLNTWEIIKVTKIKKHWYFWQFIPVAGWFISIWLIIEFVKLFGRFSLTDHALTAFVPFIYLPYMANIKIPGISGRRRFKRHKKSATREWIDAAIFAIVAATLIRTFVFEAYTIPTGSMEKTLLVNDFLFVSKLSYGPRIPNTPLAVPFVHNALPVFNSKSYTEAISLPYRRWFASPVKRSDVVVFNLPAGDTLTKERDSQDPYYDILRREQAQQYYQLKDQIRDSAQLASLSYQRARDAVWEQYTIDTRPVDKRENYIKRCVGIAGDTLELKEGILYVNGEKAFISPTSATDYLVFSKKLITEEDLRDAV
jgi:signal peptidase I